MTGAQMTIIVITVTVSTLTLESVAKVTMVAVKDGVGLHLAE